MIFVVKNWLWKSNFWNFFYISLIIQNSKFNNFLWVCWFLCKNLFVPPAWKLHNPYCHNAKIPLSYVLITKKLFWTRRKVFLPWFFATNKKGWSDSKMHVHNAPSEMVLSCYALQQGRTGLDKALLGLGWLWAWLK